jgi:hypothetical protein
MADDGAGMKGIWAPALVLVLASPVGANGPAGAALYADHCAVCHGAGLRGDGPMADILLIPPPDLTRIAERYGGVFPRAGIARRIDGRDLIPSHGGDMPMFAAMFSARSVIMLDRDGQSTLISPEARDLVAYLEAQQE